jgi:holo-ACP synthase CitX
MRDALLHARDARQAVIERASGRHPTLVFGSTSIPGAEKNPYGLLAAFAGASERLAARLAAALIERGTDAAGPWVLLGTSATAVDAKGAAVDIEATHPAGRLLDFDVYRDGRQIDRATVGLPPRGCLVCDLPAVECIRLKRHEAGKLAEAVGRLLQEEAIAPPDRGLARPRDASWRATERLASCLVAGARIELALTPKPGLVDRDDNGSHPDLSYELMTRSIELLPVYYAELLDTVAGPTTAVAGLKTRATPRATPRATANATARATARATADAAPVAITIAGPRTRATASAAPIPIAACVAAGQRAEARMIEAIGANAHRGYIFLSGLALLGSVESDHHLRNGIRRVARLVGESRRSASDDQSHGARARREHALGGIVREALDGFPSVFDHALPALRARRAAAGLEHQQAVAPGGDHDESLLGAMAVLMQHVEDTTAVHRAGPAGLARLREDGRQLQAMIEDGRPCLAWLRNLNVAYRRLDLTMGGVADCLALTIAIDRWMGG